MMLYMGLLVDLWPVKRYAYAHSDFIYVDGLPRSKYFRPDQAGWKVSKSKETMVAHIRANLKSDDALASDEALQNDVHVFRLQGGATLKYFFNRKDVDIPNDLALRDVLPQVTAVYIQGYVPLVWPQLPSSKMCYSKEILSTKFDMPDTVSVVIGPEVDNDLGFGHQIRCNECNDEIEL
jgi:hypothetical protein